MRKIFTVLCLMAIGLEVGAAELQMTNQQLYPKKYTPE